MNFDRIEGRKRAVIEHVSPQVDAGRFPIKRVVGEKVRVRVALFTDGHDRVSGELLYKRKDEEHFKTTPLRYDVNDEWTAEFFVHQLGTYQYTVRAWVDHFLTWQQDLRKKFDAGQDIMVHMMIGVNLIDEVYKRASQADAAILRGIVDQLDKASPEEQVAISHGEELARLMFKYPDPALCVTYPKTLEVLVDRTKAIYSSWYEFFPRSFGENGRHGTLRDGLKLLGGIAKMGFDVVYLPPIHPIGKTNRKGKNNSPVSKPGEPGSPWAIGAAEGGHKSINPDLGTMEDFEAFVKATAEHGMEVAMDIAYQCAPDHPWVKEHPEWFRMRPDGTIQFAENPPKKYEDIVPLNFETEDWQTMWNELTDVVLFWAGKGVRIFRIDNPHTKPFAFWEYLIANVRAKYPDAIFLAEAFTRPKVMKRLAKLGFDQSYTYFTWRNTKYELEEYIRELTQTESVEYMRPNFWPNTPDILPEFLQYGGRAAFVIRLILAGTLSSSYGVYGPAFEQYVSQAVEGKEEYLDSEKYEIKKWDLDQPGSLRPLMERLNGIRQDNPALQQFRTLRLFKTDNDMILCYGKMTEDKSNIIVTVINLDPYHKQSGWVQLPLEELDIDPYRPFLMHDLVSGDKYIWHSGRSFVALDPHTMPAHILRVQKQMRRERDFDYFM